MRIPFLFSNLHLIQVYPVYFQKHLILLIWVGLVQHQHLMDEEPHYRIIRILSIHYLPLKTTIYCKAHSIAMF